MPKSITAPIMPSDDSSWRVAILVVSYKSHHDVLRCLDAIAALSTPPAEIVICENGGEACAEELRNLLSGAPLSRLPVTLISADNPGFAGGVNRCLDAASPDCDAWWILNPDTCPEPQAMRALIDRASKRDVDAVGSVLALDHGRVQAFGGLWRSAMARPVSLGMGSGIKDAVEQSPGIEARQNYLLGASMFILPNFISKAGRMRDDYFLYCEEVEWCLRGLRNGARLGFAPESIVHHIQGTTTGSGGAIRDRAKLPIYLDERNKLNVVRDTTPSLVPVAAICSLGLLVARYVRGRALRQMSFALSGWAAGLRGERGPPRWLKYGSRG